MEDQDATAASDKGWFDSFALLFVLSINFGGREGVIVWTIRCRRRGDFSEKRSASEYRRVE